jgi:hypothetical protein
MSEPETDDNETPADAELRCDTCGRISTEVKRVVVDSGYNRANARPLYNCPECYEAKCRQRDPAGTGRY